MICDSVYISHSLQEGVEVAVSFFRDLIDAYVARNIEILTSKNQNKTEAIERSKVFLIVLNETYITDSSTIAELDCIKNQVAVKNARLFFVKIDNSNIEEFVSTDEVYDFKDFDFNYLLSLGVNKNVLPEKYYSYLNVFVDLAFAIRQTIFPPIENNQQPTLYLAQSGENPISCYTVLKREFEHHGYRIVPEQHLILSPTLRNEVDEVLKNVNFAILLVGDINKLSEAQSRLIEIQHERLLNRFINIKQNDKNARYWIWCCSDIDINNDNQMSYLTQYLSVIKNRPLIEFSQTPIEVFKQIVVNKLELAGRVEISSNKLKLKKQVYLICEKNDDADVEILKKKINEYKADLILLSPCPNMSLQQVHRENLCTCDLSIILYKNTNENWLRSKIYDVIKSAGWGRKKTTSNNIILNYSGNQISSDLIDKLNLGGIAVVSELTDTDLKNILYSYE